MKKLPVKLPAFCEECLKSFAKCSAAKYTSVQDQSKQDLSKAIMWNYKFICIGGKSVHFRNLTEKGILRLEDLISDSLQTGSLNGLFRVRETRACNGPCTI